MVFLGLFARVLMALSMLLCVTFNVGMREVWMLHGCEDGVKEEGEIPSSPSSTMLR